MKDCFKGYDFLFDCDLQDSFENIYGKMFERVKSGDVLILPDHTKTPRESAFCRIVYESGGKEAAFAEIRALINSIRKLAGFAGKDGVIEDMNAVTRDANLYEAYSHYIAPFGYEGFDSYEINHLHRKWLETESFENFTDEETTLINDYKAAVKKTAEGRVGKNTYAYELIIFAQRLFLLYALKAPDCVIRTEQLNLLKAFCVHKFSEAF